VFEGLQRDLEKLEKNDAQKEPDNPDGESSEERVAWALAIVKEQKVGYGRLLTDLRLSMDAVSFPLYLFWGFEYVTLT